MVGKIVSPPRVGRVQAKECHLPEFRRFGLGVLAFMGLRFRGLGFRFEGVGKAIFPCSFQATLDVVYRTVYGTQRTRFHGASSHFYGLCLEGHGDLVSR